MKNILNKFILLVLGIAVTANQSCKKDYPILGGATGEQVFNTAKGTMGVAIGTQRIYASSVLFSMCDANGLVTNETFLLNVGNASELQLSSGGATVDNTNALLTNLWAQANKCIYDANNVINAAGKVPDKGYASGLIGYASIIKALSIGCLSQFWENVPDTTGLGLTGTNTTFITRTQGFSKAITAIDNALALIAANPIPANFSTDLPAGMDVTNGLKALKARYSLFIGNYSTALAAANSVDLTKAVTFNYDAATANPIFASVTSTNNIYQPVDSTLGLPVGVRPALNDSRVQFYTVINPDPTKPPRFRMNGFWNTSTKPIPVYLPDEMKLIKAECLLRQASPDAVTAQGILDAMLKQVPTGDPFGIGANISAGYTGASDVASLLNEVYRNRCINLFHTGLKLEDMRRFNRPLSERKRNFFPYPVSERNNNSNTPKDPDF
jgi:starch-binding outer membrane protein, SusD/RagB family